MKNHKEVAGIDVSKKTNDAFCHQTQVHKEFVNDVIGYKSLIKWVLKVTKESAQNFVDAYALKESSIQQNN